MGIYHCLCKRCGYEWDPVGRDWPRKCPNCQSLRWGSSYWTSPRVKLSVDTVGILVPKELKIKTGKKVDKLPDRWYSR